MWKLNGWVARDFSVGCPMEGNPRVTYRGLDIAVMSALQQSVGGGLVTVVARFRDKPGSIDHFAEVAWCEDGQRRDISPVGVFEQVEKASTSYRWFSGVVKVWISDFIVPRNAEVAILGSVIKFAEVFDAIMRATYPVADVSVYTSHEREEGGCRVSIATNDTASMIAYGAREDEASRALHEQAAAEVEEFVRAVVKELLAHTERWFVASPKLDEEPGMQECGGACVVGGRPPTEDEGAGAGD